MWRQWQWQIHAQWNEHNRTIGRQRQMRWISVCVRLCAESNPILVEPYVWMSSIFNDFFFSLLLPNWISFRIFVSPNAMTIHLFLLFSVHSLSLSVSVRRLPWVFPLFYCRQTFRYCTIHQRRQPLCAFAHIKPFNFHVNEFPYGHRCSLAASTTEAKGKGDDGTRREGGGGLRERPHGNRKFEIKVCRLTLFFSWWQYVGRRHVRSFAVAHCHMLWLRVSRLHWNGNEFLIAIVIKPAEQTTRPNRKLEWHSRATTCACTYLGNHVMPPQWL